MIRAAGPLQGGRRSTRLGFSVEHRIGGRSSSLEQEILAAFERHDTPPEELRAVEKRADEINASATKKILDVRFVMREQLSDAQCRAPLSPPAAH